MSISAHSDLHKIIGPNPVARNEQTLRSALFYLAERIDAYEAMRVQSRDEQAELEKVRELNRRPLTGRSVIDPKQEPRDTPNTVELRLRHAETFTAKDRVDDRRLRMLELCYSEHPDYLGIIHKLADDQDAGTQRTVTYVRRADIDNAVDDELRWQSIAAMFPSADVELVKRAERMRGTR